MHNINKTTQTHTQYETNPKCLPCPSMLTIACTSCHRGGRKREPRSPSTPEQVHASPLPSSLPVAGRVFVPDCVVWVYIHLVVKGTARQSMLFIFSSVRFENQRKCWIYKNVRTSFMRSLFVFSLVRFDNFGDIRR